MNSPLNRHPIWFTILALLIVDVIVLRSGLLSLTSTPLSPGFPVSPVFAIMPIAFLLFLNIGIMGMYPCICFLRARNVSRYGTALGISKADISMHKRKYYPLASVRGINFGALDRTVPREVVAKKILEQLDVVNMHSPSFRVPIWVLAEYIDAPYKNIRAVIPPLIESGELVGVLHQNTSDSLVDRLATWLVTGEQDEYPRVQLGARRQAMVHQYGSNPRVNIDSHDESVNIVNVNAPASAIFNDLKSAVAAAELDPTLAKLDPTLQARTIHQIEEMEHTHNTPGFKDRYQAFVTSVAMHATLLIAVTPFLPALAQMVETIPK